MRPRAGVSLAEVLVAAVLLAIGIGGSLSAFSTALRLRTRAAARESASALAQDRLTWFAARGCAIGDTGFARPVGAGREAWAIARDSGGVRLAGAVRPAPDLHPLRVESRLRCD